MKYWGISLYLISLVMQFISILLVLHLFRKVRFHRVAYCCLILALSLVMFERVAPLIECCVFGSFNTSHVVISAFVSIFILVGLLGVKNIVDLSDRQRRELEKIGRTDHLTGVSSRFEIEWRIEDEFQRGSRSGHPTSLLMIDIDHFKKVNDTYGHPVGDRVLRSLTDVCRSTLREIDSIGRFGGEEFLVMLPEAGTDEAFKVAERLRVAVANHVCAHVQGVDVKIQISIGVSTFNPRLKPGINGHHLMQEYVKRADEAMYRAKQAGRNQTQCWS